MSRGLALACLAGALITLFLPWPSAGAGVGMAGPALRWLAVAGLLMLPGLHAVCSPRRAPRFAGPATWVAAALCGAALSAGEVSRLSTLRWPAAQAGADYQVTGTIASLPRILDAHGGKPVVRFELRVELIDCPEAEPDCLLPRQPPTRLQVVDGSSVHRYEAGDRWRWRLRLQPPDGLLNPGTFDRERWLLLQRINARASVRAGTGLRLSSGSGRADGWLHRLRLRSSDRLLDRPAGDLALAEGDPQVVAALALGRGDLITPAWRERLQRTGTAHLIAISGLHVGLVFGLFSLLVGAVGGRLTGLAELSAAALARLASRPHDEPEPVMSTGGHPAASRFGRLLPRSLGADGAALCVAAGYAALSGFGLPVQRALLMLAVLVLLRRRARVVAPGTSLALAVLGVLMLDPLAPLSNGFWLSAGAVAMLIWCGTGRILSSARGWRARWTRTLGAQLWLSALLIPVGAWAFQQVSLVSAPANLLAIPFVGIVVVPLSLASTVLLSLELPGGNAVMTAALAAAAALRHALDAAAAVPHASLVATLPDAHVLLLCLGGIVLSGVVVSVRLRMAWCALLPILAMPAMLWGAFGHPVRGIEMHVLDVGHGLAVLVLTPRHTVLFDTGGGRGDGLRVRRVVMPYLQALGRRRVDRLVISHLDADHAAGLPWLAERFTDMPLNVPDIAAAREHLPAGVDDRSRLQPCRAGSGFELDGVAIDFLHPAEHDAGSRNDRSCVALISAGAIRLLLSGDIESAAERKLVRRAGALPVHVLVAPHHGSDSSSSEAFVQAFPARDVVFAAARRSRWGFPHAAVRMRYKITGARPHTVGETGALVFRFDASAMHQGRGDCCAPSTARQAARRLWRQP